MKTTFKVICKGITYGTYNVLNRARERRAYLKTQNYSDIVIRVTQDDVDPRNL